MRFLESFPLRQKFCGSEEQQNSDEPPGTSVRSTLVVTRQLVLILVSFYGLRPFAFRLGGASIVSSVEFHFRSLNDLWLAVDEVIHHDDVMALIVIWPRGNVAGFDQDRRDAGVVELDPEEGQVSIAR
jgi:hypothetical protein